MEPVGHATDRLSITVVTATARHHSAYSNTSNSNRRSLRNQLSIIPRHLLIGSLALLFCHTAVSQQVSSSTHHVCSVSDIFYNATLCTRHERDVRTDQDIRRQRSKDREDKKIKAQEEEDDDMDIDPDLLPAAAAQPEPEVIYQGASGTCGGCRPREELRKHSLETIKSEILSKLGMAQAPNIKGRFRPDYGVSLLVAKYKNDQKNSYNQYQLRRHHTHSNQQGLQWVSSDDESVQMQGDAPAESSGSGSGAGRGNIKDTNNNYVRSHLNSSDSRYSDAHAYQEGEPVYMDEEDDYHVRTKKIVAFSLPHPKLRHMPDIQYFHFSDKAQSNKVKRAVLWVYIRGHDSLHGPAPVGTSINITVYRLHRSQQGRSTDSPILVPVIGWIPQPIPRGDGQWINLEYNELEKLVGEWFRSPQQNTGLVINATDRQGTNLAVTTHYSSLNISAVPFLEVYLSENKKHRTKRTLGLNCNDSSNETRCCRYPLTVNFEEFGWDWIIAPKTYEANFCDGECPMVFMQDYAHTHLTQLSRRTGSGPCCAPRKLSPISMLYFDNNMNIMYGTVPAMVVDRCGCM